MDTRMPQVNRVLAAVLKAGISVGTVAAFLTIVGIPGAYNFALRHWPDLRARFQVLLPLILFALLAIDYSRMKGKKPVAVYCTRGLVAGCIAAFLALHLAELMAPAGLQKMFNSFSVNWSAALAAQLWHGLFGTFGWLYGSISGSILWILDRSWQPVGQSICTGRSSEMPQSPK